jgi:nucleoid-associated protein YgaU
MHEYRPNRGRVSAWRSGAFLGIAVFFAYASVLRGQDVVEAARQEQAHKAAQKNTPKHIYTEEDLKKDRILTPDDQARVAARKPQQGSAPGQESAEAQKPAEPEAQTESLGEFARRYRKEKEERQAEEARKKNYTPFDYELTHPAVAAPKAGVVPLPEIRANQPHANLPSSVVSPGAPPRLPQPIRGGGRARVSPFQPRPLPVAPPAVRVIPVPAPPAITSVPRPAPPSRPVESVSKRGLRPVVVQTGDSWWRLASRYLGSGSRWRELRALTPGAGTSPEVLRAGTTVLVPEGNNVQADSSLVTMRTQIRVKPGDTLWTLAREHLGRGSAWTCLAKLNPEIQDYQRMAVGTALRVPDRQNQACSDSDTRLENSPRFVLLP